jgi:hypothetical protein
MTHPNRTTTTAALALALPLLLAACGGGGGNAGGAKNPSLPDQSANSAARLDAYAGTWTSACAAHAIDTAVVARASGADAALTMAVTTNYYGNTTCTGDIIATQTWSAPVTATYGGTVASSVVLAAGTAAQSASVDKVTAQLPQRTVALTGAYVSHKIVDAQPSWCIDYAGSTVCVPDRVYPAESAPFDGLAAIGGEMVLVKSNGTNYDAVERFTKR